MTNQPVLLVTGASSGIGEATARLFARRGYRVGLAARREERLQALAEEIRQAGGDALVLAADVSQPAEIENMVAACVRQWGQIDVLFNNAGFGRLNWLENLHPVDDIAAQLQVNLIGLIQTARAVLPHMISRRQGHIINMSSIAGLIGTPTYSIYAASKFGIRGFTEALRREVSIHGIRVSGIYPGAVKTEFTDHTGARRRTSLATPGFMRLESEDVARAVWSLARWPRRSLVIPWPMRFAVLGNALLPGLVDWVIERRFVAPERQP